MKMKNKLYSKYILLIFLTCILSINSSTYDISYYNTTMNSFYGLIFPNLLYLILVIYTFDIINIYNKNYFAFLRFKNKKEYIDNLLKYCFNHIKNLFIIFYIIFLIIISIYYFINTKTDINIIEIIVQLIFILYNMFKVFIITELLIKIGIILTKSISKKCSSIYFALILILRYSWHYNYEIVNSFSKVHLFYGYFYKLIEYNTIFLDLFSFILQIIILLGILELIKKMMIKYKKIYIEE